MKLFDFTSGKVYDSHEELDRAGVSRLHAASVETAPIETAYGTLVGPFVRVNSGARVGRIYRIDIPGGPRRLRLLEDDQVRP